MTSEDTVERVRDGGYDEFLDALADGEGYYCECPNGHGSLPPRRVCPECGERTLHREPLPDQGTVVTYTIVQVPTPQFEDDAPYATVIATFGPVRLTGIVRDVTSVADLDVDATVKPGVAETVDGTRRLIFEKR